MRSSFARQLWHSPRLRVDRYLFFSRSSPNGELPSSEVEDHRQLHFHCEVLTGDGTILHIAAKVLQLQAGDDLEMLGDDATIDKAQAGGAVTTIQIRLRISGRGSLRRAD